MNKTRLILHDYQAEAVNKFDQWYRDDSSMEALIALTMGMGKTVTASSCVNRVIEQKPDARVLWLTHREELIEQAKCELETYTDQHCEVEQAGQRYTGLGKIVVGSVATLRGKRLQKLAEYFTPDLIVCDEAHHALALTWMQVKQTFPKAKVLNLTATPYRSDVANRLDLGTVLIERNTTDGIRMGVLVPPKPVGKIEINLGMVKKRLGDYDAGSLSELLCHDEIVKACTQLIQEHAPGHKGILFAASVEHGRKISERLRQAGFRVGEVYGETPTEERQKYYNGIRSGTLDILVNNIVLTEGFNLPELDMVIMLRPTKNAALYLQAVGRGLRRDPKNPEKKHCLIIDVIDTAKRTGGGQWPMPNEEDLRRYSALHGRKASLPELFLSWFYRVDDLGRLLQKSITITQCARLDTPEKVHGTLALPWFQKIPDNPAIATLAKVWTAAGEFEDLLQPFRAGNAEALRLMLSRKGWVYLPHNQMPKNEERLVDLASQAGADTGQERNYTISTFISHDAQLRNFIMDLFDPNESLREQAAKCYELFPIGQFGRHLAWFKVLQHSDIKFHFIQWKDDKRNHILARTEDGLIFSFEQDGYTKLTHIPGHEFSHTSLPDFAKGTSWARQVMSERQTEHVCNILSISKEEALSLRISKLSASALMSNHWNRGHLKNIVRMLADKKNLQPAIYEEDCDPRLDVSHAVA